MRNDVLYTPTTPTLLRSLMVVMTQQRDFQSWLLRARFHGQSLFAKYLHALVSDFQNICHLKCFNCLSILRNRYNP